ARIRLARGDAARAVTAAEAAVTANPDDTEAALLLIRSLRARGETARAERELRSRLAQQPESAPLHVELGWIELGARQLAAARAAFEEARRLAPRAFDAREGLVAVMLAEGAIDDARAKTAEWTAEEPSSINLQVLQARVAVAA